MFLKLTITLCAGLYLAMLTLGAKPADTVGSATAGTRPAEPVSARSDFSPSATPTASGSLSASSVQAIAAAAGTTGPVTGPAAPETADQQESDAGLLKITALDAPDHVLQQLAETPTAEAEARAREIVEVTGRRVNLRAGPSLSDDVVNQLWVGARAEKLGNTPDGWVKIRDLASGDIGYMSAEYLAPASRG